MKKNMSRHCGIQLLAGKKLLFFSILSFGLLFALPSLAATWYVDGDSGNDTTGAGTETAPYATVTKALTVISGGDTIYCQGTIADSVTLTSSHSGTANSDTIITNWPDSSAVIDGTGNEYIFNIDTGASYITVQGLNLTGASNSAFYGPTTSSYISILNNNIYGLSGGALAYPINLVASDNLLLSGNEIDGGGNCRIGIDIEGSDSAVIEQNQVHDFTNMGILIDAQTSNSVIKNNFIYNIGGADNYYIYGIAIADSTIIEVYNNSLYNTYDESYPVSAIAILTSSYDLHHVSIKNNIIQKANRGIDFDGPYDNITIDYNNFYATDNVGAVSSVDYQSLAEWQAATGYDENSTTQNPLYNSTTSGSENLHLTDESPMVDAGTKINSNNNDIDGEDRPYNITDIGADERPVLFSAPAKVASVSYVKKIDFSWKMNNSYSVTDYLIQVSANQDLSSSKSKIAVNKKGTRKKLKPAKKYYAAVQARYTTDYDTYTSANSTKLTLSTKPRKVAKIKKLETYTNQVRYRWKKYKRVKNYTIKLMDEHGKKIRFIKIKRKKKFVQGKKKFVKKIIKNLEPGTTYKIKIRGKKKVDGTWYKGRWSDAKTFMTL